LNQLFDPVRLKKLALLPEEVVRQKLILQMTLNLGYPKGLIAVEKELESLPHLEGKKIPLRRADLLVFAKNLHPLYPLYPLLIVECKKDRLSDGALRQALGYNYYVKAYFVAVAGKDEVRLAFQNQSGKQQVLDFLPSYAALVEAVKKPK
jgi:hypothetical protein